MLNEWVRRSREGAWIEISTFLMFGSGSAVAPARERGLKYHKQERRMVLSSRSREGAWIEMLQYFDRRRQRYSVAPARERGLKSYALYGALLCLLSLPRGSVD